MQCVSCQFENMPGVGVCGRCGSPLGLRTLAVDVQPPRAAPWVKRLRRLLPFRSAYYEARDAGRALVHDSGLGDAWRMQLPGTFIGVFGRALVPGWPQFYLGQPLRGRFFLFVYLILLFLSFLLYGSSFGSMLLGFAFSVHVASCVSVLHLGGLRGGAYWTGVLAAFFLLLVGVYLPTGWMLSRVASPAELRYDAPPFAYGDVVLYCPATYWFRDPQTGDVVLYDQRGGTMTLGPQRHGYIRVDAGQRIDRILAGPGERIQWQDGRLFVQGQAAPFQPLNPAFRMPNLHLDIPEDHYLLLPTGGPDIPVELTEDSWRSLILVPRSSLRGRVFLRSFPLTRIQRIS